MASQIIPQLKPIDLSKIDKEHCNHQDIDITRPYLARIKGEWYAGNFARMWYGLSFDAVFDSGFQLDYEGWEELYEIIEQDSHHPRKPTNKPAKRA